MYPGPRHPFRGQAPLTQGIMFASGLRGAIGIGRLIHFACDK
jgi:hypothetical protein